MFKNNKLIKASITIVLGIGLWGSLTINRVNAATQRIILKHNAYVYDNRGHRTSRKPLRRGHNLVSYRNKIINGTKFLNIGHGRYIKIGNARKVNLYLFKIYIDGPGTAYKKPSGKELHESFGGKQKVFATYQDNKGLTWYRITKTKWIKSTETNKPKLAKKEKTEKTPSETSKSNTDTSTSNIESNVDDNSSKTSEQPVSNPVIEKPVTLSDDVIEQTNQEFLKLLNDWRASLGKLPVSIDHSLKDYAIQRAQHNAHSWDILKYGGDHHNGTNRKYGECEYLVPLSSPKEMAERAFKSFVYEDGDVNWGHRDNLAQPGFNKCYIGLALTHQNKYYKNGVAFNVDMEYNY